MNSTPHRVMRLAVICPYCKMPSHYIFKDDPQEDVHCPVCDYPVLIVATYGDEEENEDE